MHISLQRHSLKRIFQLGTLVELMASLTLIEHFLFPAFHLLKQASKLFGVCSVNFAHIFLS